MDIQVERLTEATLDGAVETIRSLPEFFYERDFVKAEANYREFVSGHKDDDLFLVARSGDQVLGVVGATKRQDADGVYFLASFAVKKGQRGGGIGRRLLESLEGELAARDGRMMYTETTTASYCDSTRAFYEAVGYTMVAEVPDFWADGDPLALYQKRL